MPTSNCKLTYGRDFKLASNFKPTYPHDSEVGGSLPKASNFKPNYSKDLNLINIKPTNPMGSKLKRFQIKDR